MVAFETGPGAGGDIHVSDLSTGVSRHVTRHPARDADPSISPDGKTIVFRSDRDGGHLYQRGVGTVGDEVLLFKGSSRESPDDWSPDGRYVIFVAQDDIWALPLERERRPFRVTDSPAVDREGRCRRTADGLPTSLVSPVETKSTCKVSRNRCSSSRCHREAASFRVGVTMAPSCSICPAIRH